jgi:hypothetical protein
VSDERRAKPRGLSDVIKSAGTSVREIAEAVVSSAKELADAAEDVAGAGASRVRVAAERASSSARDIAVSAQHIVSILQSASEDATRADRLLARFIEALGHVKPQLDARADGVVIGYFGQGGVALQRVSGVEIGYVRGERPQIRVSRLDGKGARLAAGVATSAYAGCLYGDPAILSRPLVRRGADVGVAVAAIGFFRASTEEASGTAGGWLVSLSAGLNVGVPILSDLSAFEIFESPLGGAALTPMQAAEIESLLAEAPDRSWRRGIAQSLGK